MLCIMLTNVTKDYFIHVTKHTNLKQNSVEFPSVIKESSVPPWKKRAFVQF